MCVCVFVFDMKRIASACRLGAALTRFHFLVCAATQFSYRSQLEQLFAKSKPPIVVGGTNYYIESLLWDILVSSKDRPPNDDAIANVSATKTTATAATTTTTTTAMPPLKAAVAGDDRVRGELEDISMSEHANNREFLSNATMANMSAASLHHHLRRIDADSAHRIHPNNKRKIMRAIEVYQESGGRETLSAKLRAQRAQPGGNRLGGPLRYPHTILFWLRCQQDVLNERLDKRVDAMLEQGLLREIRAFYDEHYTTSGEPKSSTTTSTTASMAASGAAAADTSLHYDHYERDDHVDQHAIVDDQQQLDTTKGVLQTIGFKEFIPYLKRFNAANDQKIEEYLMRNAYQMPTTTTTAGPPTKRRKQTLKAESTIHESSLNNADANGSATNSNTTTTTTTTTTIDTNTSATISDSIDKHKTTATLMKYNNQRSADHADGDRIDVAQVDVDDDDDNNDSRIGDRHNDDDDDDCRLPAGLNVLRACLDELKLVTRRYSKKQLKWINNRFLASKDRQVPAMYELDTSDVSNWHLNVYQRAITVIDCYRSDIVCDVMPMTSRIHPGAGLNEETSNFCEICQRHFIGEYQWRLHLKSNKHKRCKESKNKKLKKEQQQTQQQHLQQSSEINAQPSGS